MSVETYLTLRRIGTDLFQLHLSLVAALRLGVSAVYFFLPPSNRVCKKDAEDPQKLIRKLELSHVYNAVMTNSELKASTRNSKLIKASAAQIYCAFTDPEALVVWQAPGEMTARIHDFDLRTGGGYTMSLYYSQSEESRGKTSQHEDRFTAQFLELTPFKRIVEAITFDSDNPAFSGKMFMLVTLIEEANGTNVTIEFENIPSGITPADNEAGTQSSLEKLDQYCRGGTP